MLGRSTQGQVMSLLARGAAALVGFSVAFAAACASKPAKPPAPRLQAPAAARSEPPPVDINGSARLSDAVTPIEYDLDFQIDPRLDRFSGLARIELEISEPTQTIRLHAAELDVSRAEALPLAGPRAKRRFSADVLEGQEEGLGLHFERALSGRVALELEYTGSLGEVPMSLYRAREGQHWYAFTQFEPLAARGAFPCFDEPRFKTPFRVTVTTPASMQALSNAPLSSRRVVGQQASHEFAPTPPLPTYLLALVVGDVEVTPPQSSKRPPLRIVSTQGKSLNTDYVLQQTPKILDSLVRYFDMQYPYQKLDMVAVPSFRAGAMENPGLVTYRDKLLVIDGKRGSQRDKLRSRAIIAHELAHIWFGDLVTMQWWDDLWLNEAFATWMSNRVLQEVAPEVSAADYAVTSKVDVMSQDELLTATPIRKRIETPGDIRNAFDGITYSKGAAVLRMLENWVGEELFRDGLRLYVRRHAWGNASQADLFAALDETAGQCLSCVAKGFTEQPGVPLVEAELSCEPGRPPAVLLSQRRFVPGSASTSGEGAEPGKAEQSDAELWRIPVCVRVAGGGTQCQVMTERQHRLQLDVDACPRFVHPNAGEFGYYRWSVPEAMLSDLVGSKDAALTTAEWVALPSQVGALLAAGRLSVRTYLGVLQAASSKPERLVLDGVIKQLMILDRIVGVSEARTAFSKLATRWLLPHARRVGVTPKPGEPVESALLRRDLFSALNQLGDASAFVATARATAEAFIGNPSDVAPDVAELHVPLAAGHGDEALHAGLVRVVKESELPSARATALDALANFDDPDLLRRSYELLLDGTLRAQDYGTLQWSSVGSEAKHQVFWKFYTEREAQIIELLGHRSAARLPWAARGFCSSGQRDAVKAHFGDLKRFGSGAAQNLAQALEYVNRCIVLRELVADDLTREIARRARR